MRAIFKFVFMVLLLLVALVPLTLFWLLRLEKLRQWTVRASFYGFNFIMGLRVDVHGSLTDRRPVLLVTNHCSYVDIFTLAQVAPISFTPKSDIKFWPLIGWSCVVGGCVFVERKPHKIPATRERIHKGLKLGRAVCLFAEGTTNNGLELKPFKSGFFSLAEGEDGLVVQPATIVYTHVEGKEVTAEERSQIAWHGDASMIPHMMHYLSWKSVRVSVYFHEPVTMASFDNRKELCRHCESVVKARYEEHRVA